MKEVKIMKFKKFMGLFNIRESFKQKRMDEILDKMFNKEKLSTAEQDFLDNYDDKRESDVMIDHMMLDKETTYIKITSILEKGISIICNLNDRNGPIGMKIESIYNEFNSETSIMTLENGVKFPLKDNFLYNIIYDIKLNIYSLEEHNEYFEKIPVNNDD